MKIQGPLLLAGASLVASLCLGADPASLSCDFESGLDGWRGDGRLVADETGNKVCQLKKTGKRKVEITQQVELEGDFIFEVHYRARALAGGEKIEIRRSIRTSSGAGFSGHELIPDGKWVQKSFSAKAQEGERSAARIIAITFHEGEGVVQIDDIKVVKKPR